MSFLFWRGLLADVCNGLGYATNQFFHSGHQVVVKNVAKCEFVLGLAKLMVDTLGSGSITQIHGLMAELIEDLEIMKALVAAAEDQAQLDQWGVMCPDPISIIVARNQMIKIYPRMAEIIQLLGSSSLMALPSESDFDGPLAQEIEEYLYTETASAQDRVRLFHLAWDLACSAFGSRQVLYERFFQVDWMRNATVLYQAYDTEPLTQQVKDFLNRD